MSILRVCANEVTLHVLIKIHLTIQGPNDYIWAYISHEYYIQVKMLGIHPNDYMPLYGHVFLINICKLDLIA